MRVNFTTTCVCVIAATFAQDVYSQKVKVGYDKGVDFSKFASYTWADPTTPPTRPLLYQVVVSSIDAGLNEKGLNRVNSNGDLVVIPSGGIGFGLNIAAGTPIMSTYSGPPPAMNATMWTGAGGPANLMAPYVGEGTLMLTFVNRATNTVIWNGAVTEKLDMENKNKSLERIENSIVKLLKEFPPKKK
jgi:Domain of unknown function (DUF4136)